MTPALLLAIALDPPAWVEGRVWPDAPAARPAVAESLPAVDPALGVHSAVHRVDLSGCWRQHAAWAGDLDLWMCADVAISKRGRVKARVVHLSAERPGLDTCLEATLEAWEPAPGPSARGTVCRAVQTHLSESAKATWVKEPWAELMEPAAPTDSSRAPTPTVGRPQAERALRLDGLGGSQPAGLTLRDRPVTTAKRHVELHAAALKACWADHASWRTPEPVDGATVQLTLDVTVGDAGALTVAPGRTVPATHAGLTACAAAGLDPDLPVSEGDVVVTVPVAFPAP